MRTELCLLLVTLTTACAESPRPPAANAEPTPVAPTSPPPAAVPAPPPTASASSVPDVVQEPAPLPLPPAPPGTDPEKAMFAASLCAAAYLGKDVGCRSHPPFERPAQKPDGKFVEHQGDPLLFCGIDQVYRGSFTKPGAKQAVVSFAQCKESEDAMWDSGFPGSAVLAEEIDGRWKAIDYEPDVNVMGCLQDHKSDGRDVLICRSGLGAPPSGEVRYFFSLDFARGAPGKSHALSFAKVFGDLQMCGMVGEGLPTGLIWLDVTSMKLAKLNNDGTDDVVVKIKRSRLPPSKSLDAKARAACKSDVGLIEGKSVLPPAKLTTLEFLSDGERFVPSPTTQKILELWKKESPDDFNGLIGAGPPLE